MSKPNSSKMIWRLAGAAALLVCRLVIVSSTSVNIDCVLPKPKFLAAAECNFSDGTSYVTGDCQRMHFSYPAPSSYRPLPSGARGLPWYFTFAEPLTLAVAKRPPWGIVRDAISTNITKDGVISMLMHWQLKHHLIVTLILTCLGLLVMTWSVIACYKCRVSRKYRPRPAFPDGQHRFCSVILAIFSSSLLLFLIFALVTSGALSEWGHSQNTNIIRDSDYNLDVYVNNTIQLASHLVNNQLGFLFDTATSRLDRLGHLLADQTSWLVYNATKDVTEAVLNVVNESRSAVETLISINKVELSMKKKETAIRKQLAVVQKLTASLNCQAGDVLFHNCVLLQENVTALMVVANYQHLPNVTSVAYIAKKVYDSDISAQASSVWPKFQGIPCDIQQKTASFLVDARKEIFKVRHSVVENINSIFKRQPQTQPHKPAGAVIPPSQDKIHGASFIPTPSTDEDVGETPLPFTLIRHNESVVEAFWKSYHWAKFSRDVWNPVHSAFTVLTTLHVYWRAASLSSLLLLLLLAVIPLSLVMLKIVRQARSRRWQYKQGAVSQRFAKLYAISGPIAVAYCFAAVGLVYVIAGTAEVFCKPIQSMEVFDETIDDVPAVMSYYVLNKYVLPPGSPPMTVRELLEQCKGNASLYQSLRLGDRVDIHSLFNISKVKELVNQHLSKASGAFSIKDQSILTISAQLKLLRLHSNTSGLKSISFTTFDEATSQPVMSASPTQSLQMLYTVMNEVSLGLDFNSSDTRYENDLQRLSLNLVIVRRELAELVELVDELRKNDLDVLRSGIATIKAILLSAVDQIPKTLDLAENLSKTLQAKAPDLVQKLMDGYVQDLLNWAVDFFNFSVDMITNKLGNCRPIADIWSGLVNTACGVTPAGLNTLYVLMAVCATLSLVTLALNPSQLSARRRNSSGLDFLLDNTDTHTIAMDDVVSVAGTTSAAELLINSTNGDL